MSPACISLPCVCSLLVVILNKREISCTKGECRLFRPQGSPARPEGQPCLSLWTLREMKEVLSPFAVFLRHCPCCPVISRRVKHSTRRDAVSFGEMRGKPYFDLTHRPSTQILIAVVASSFLSKDRLASSKTPPLSSLDR
jgi:hypothetical protein